MTGPPDLMEITVWAQCPNGCSAYITYWPSQEPAKTMTTTTMASDAQHGHAFNFRLGPLLPGTEYRYVLTTSGAGGTRHDTLSFRTQTLWKYRTDAPPFRLAMGSCAYISEPAFDRPGKSYGGGYGIFDAIAMQKPDLMVWLGDNIYLREPDWGSRSGFLHRYTHTRSTPELQRLLRSTAHCAIWDDHDFGPNDADGSFVGSRMAREIFDVFWPNPTNGVPGVEGITTSFSYYDVDFFLMDDRTFRVPADLRTAEPQLFGKKQLDWLIQALKYSDAAFKLVAVGSQVLNTAEVYENFSTMQKERGELLRRIEEEGIRGVVFITGDRHFTELSAMDLPDGRKIYDLTVSPLTSGTHSPKEKNDLRVDGTLVEQRNFATLDITGAKDQRTMTIRVYDAEGTMFWERSIPQDRKP